MTALAMTVVLCTISSPATLERPSSGAYDLQTLAGGLRTCSGFAGSSRSTRRAGPTTDNSRYRPPQFLTAGFGHVRVTAATYAIFCLCVSVSIVRNGLIVRPATDHFPQPRYQPNHIPPFSPGLANVLVSALFGFRLCERHNIYYSSVIFELAKFAHVVNPWINVSTRRNLLRLLVEDMQPPLLSAASGTHRATGINGHRALVRTAPPRSGDPVIG